MPIVDAGETYSWRLRVTDSNGNAAAPGSTPTVTVALPDGTAGAAPTVSLVSTGLYDVDWGTSAAVVGLHRWTASATGGAALGTATRSWGGVFDVRPPALMLVDTGEALNHLRAANIIVSPDDWEQLRWLCAVASEAVETDLKRSFMRQTVTEDHDVSEGTTIWLRKRPVMSLTSVTVDGALVTDLTSYRLSNFGSVVSRWGWGSVGWPGVVTVTYVTGSLTAPLVARKVALNTVQRMWQESQEADHPAFDSSDESLIPSTVETGNLTDVEMRAYTSMRRMNL